MKVCVNLSNRSALPEINELAEAMWSKGVSFSHAGDNSRFKFCNTLALSWDKWIDDIRWSMHPKSKEYVYFELKDREKQSLMIVIEVDDRAILIDKLATYKAALYIAEKCNGEISADGVMWYTPEEYKDIAEVFLRYNFNQAVEESLFKDGES